ncbi:MAG: hypothetical protein U0326_44105 [Polyangiales bacterium]
MRKTSIFLAMCVGAASACSDTTTGGGGNSLTIDTFPAAYYRALCDSLFRCPTVGDNGAAVALLENASTCAARVPALGVAGMSDMASLVRGGTIRFDGAAASECLTRVGTSCARNDAELATLCRRAFTGTVAVGGACWRSEECASGWCDHGTGTRMCPGACRAPLGTGAACTSDRQCMGWETGAAGCVSGMCAAVSMGAAAGEGQRCGVIPGTPASRVDCATGLACVNDMCRRVIAAGAPCTTSDACAAGTVCAPTVGTTTRTCAAPSALVRSATGGMCSADGRTAPLCNPLAHLECNAMNTCATLGDGAMGSRCIPGNDLLAATCNEGLRCDQTSRTCVPRAATGAACTRNSDCLSNECEGDRCLAHVCQ